MHIFQRFISVQNCTTYANVTRLSC